jgi:hypothetical protein
MAMNKQVQEREFGDYIIYSDGKVYSKRKQMFLKTHNDGRGYLMVGMSINKTNKKYKIHRILAESFIPNPLNKPMVNHKNGIKTDNRIENLEWVTNQENIIHAVEHGLCRKDYCSKSVIDLETGIFYESGSELAKLLGWIPTSFLAKLNGNRSSFKRYKFA